MGGTALKVLVLLTAVSLVAADCAFGGSPTDPKERRPLAHIPAIPPHKANPPLTYCTEYIEMGCCENTQAVLLQQQVAQSYPLFGTCPACVANFIDFWCFTTCHPKQSDFINVTATATVKGQTLVNGAEITLWKTYAERVFESCKDVVFGNTGQTVMSLIFGAQTFDQFYSYLGDPTIQSPYLMTFKYPEQFSIQKDTRNCSDSCSCKDCSPMCPAPWVPPETPACTVLGGVPCLGFGLLVGYAGVVVIILAAACCWRCYTRNERNGGDAAGAHERQALLAGEKPQASLLPPPPAAGASDREAQREAQEETYEEDIAESLLLTYNWLQRLLFRWGRIVARHPLRITSIVFTLLLVTIIGVFYVEIETHAEGLWVSPDSIVEAEKHYNDENFGRFYRSEMSVVSDADKGASGKPFVTKDKFREIMVQDLKVRNMQVPCNVTNTTTGEKTLRLLTLDDLCFKPLRGKGCAVQSPTEYFQADPTQLDQFDTDQDLRDALSQCGQSESTCMGTIGMPIDPNLVFGGFNGSAYGDAPVLFITYLLDNKPETEEMAMCWELAYLDVQREAHNYTTAYAAERSVEDELARENGVDVATIIISYLLMFVYVSIALGRVRGVRAKLLLVHSRFLLGLAGVFVVIMSVAMSVGICGFLHVKATLIITEVIPFLVLAIGVDNVFIIVNTFEREDPALPIPIRMGKTFALIGSSITLASTAESLAFVLGALTKMPAVQAFAIYAAIATFLDYLLQISLFSGWLALDARRMKGRRIDCLPCLSVGEDRPEALAVVSPSAPAHGSAATSLNADAASAVMALPDARSARRGPAAAAEEVKEGYIRAGMRYYAKFLMNDCVRVTVVIVFVAMLLAGVYFLFQVEAGLDQTQALPRDSYYFDYFTMMNKYLHLGPPVYYIVRGHNYSTRADQDVICALGSGANGCSPSSLVNMASQASMVPEYSYILRPPASWLDDYLMWLRSSQCCLWDKDTHERCHDPSDQCVACAEGRLDDAGRPTPEDFDKFMPWYMDSDCGEQCAVCGSVYQSEISFQTTSPALAARLKRRGFLIQAASTDAAHDDAARLDEITRAVEAHAADGAVSDDELMLEAVENGALSIKATRFRGYHAILGTTTRYTASLRMSRNFTAYVGQLNNIDIFPYAVHYLFFQQYLDIWSLTLQVICFALAAVLVVAFGLLRNLLAALIILVVVTMIAVELLGCMALAGILLNAISVVNIVVGIGVSVEFCVHITHAFTKGSAREQHLLEELRLARFARRRDREAQRAAGTLVEGASGKSTGKSVASEDDETDEAAEIELVFRGISRKDRVREALVDMGASVLSGITLTKFVGVCVLGFAQSLVFQVYYFRMYLCIVLLGCAHGLVLLPVLLSFVGPALNSGLFGCCARHSSRPGSPPPAAASPSAYGTTQQ